MKKTTGHVESRLRRGMECLERLEDSLQELGLQESAVEDLKVEIEREGLAALRSPENCLVQPGQVLRRSRAFRREKRNN